MNEKKNRTPLWTLLGLIFGATVTIVLLNYSSFTQPSFDKMMVKISNDMNKNCPYMVDKETRLDNTAAVGNTIAYNYTLINMGINDIDLASIKNYMEQTLVNNTKTNPDMKVFRENNATIDYNYKDKDGVFLFKVQVTPDKYK